MVSQRMLAVSSWTIAVVCCLPHLWPFLTGHAATLYKGLEGLHATLTNTYDEGRMWVSDP